MKATIVVCLKEMVEKKFSKDKWEMICENVSGLPKSLLSAVDISDETIKTLIKNTCQTLGLTLAQAADVFGDYWVNVYAQNYYAYFFTGHRTAKELILNIDNIHQAMTKSMPNAVPPKFDYNWKSDKELVLTYKSRRGLIDLAVGLLKAVGKHYKENLIVEKISDEQLKIVFQ